MRNNFAGFNSILPTTRPWPRRDNSDETLIAKIASGNRLAMQVLLCTAPCARLPLPAAMDRQRRDRRGPDHRRIPERRGGMRIASTARSTVSTWLLAIARHKARAELRRRPQALSDAQRRKPSSGTIRRATLASKDDGEGLRNASCGCPGSTARSSISSITMKNRSKRSRGSSAFRQYRNRSSRSRMLSRATGSTMVGAGVWRRQRRLPDRSLTLTTGRVPSPLLRWRRACPAPGRRRPRVRA